MEDKKVMTRLYHMVSTEIYSKEDIKLAREFLIKGYLEGIREVIRWIQDNHMFKKTEWGFDPMQKGDVAINAEDWGDYVRNKEPELEIESIRELE